MLIIASVLTQEYSFHTYDGYINISVRNDAYVLFVSVMLQGFILCIINLSVWSSRGI